MNPIGPSTKTIPASDVTKRTNSASSCGCITKRVLLLIAASFIIQHGIAYSPITFTSTRFGLRPSNSP